MGLFDFLGSGRRDRFAEQVMRRLAEMGWAHPTVYDRKTFSIELGAGEGVFPLKEIFQDLARSPRGERDLALDERIGFITELGPAPAFEDATCHLMPIVRSRSDSEAQAVDPLIGFNEEAALPLGDHLLVMVALDRRYSIRPVDQAQLKAWNRTFDEVFSLAMANLRKLDSAGFEAMDDGGYMSVFEDFHHPSRLLMPEVFEQLDLNGEPVVIVVSRRCLVVAGAGDPDAIRSMARLVLEDGAEPLAWAPLVLRNGEWRSYRPENPDLVEVRDLHALQSLHDHRVTRTSAITRLAEAGRPSSVAQLAMLDTPEGRQTLALWEDSVTLLPEADVVVLRDAAGAALARRWADVAQACAFAAEPGMFPTYYVAQGLPGDLTMDQIRAAPELAWLKGKGVGMANGRLTLFG